MKIKSIKIYDFKHLLTLLCLIAFCEALAKTNRFISFSPNNFIQTTTTITELNNAEAFTLEMQIYINPSMSGGLTNVLSKTNTLSDRIALQLKDGVIYAIVANGSNTNLHTSSAVLNPGVWYHIAMVYDGTEAEIANRIKLFINGVQDLDLVNSGTLPVITSSNTQAFKVGGTYFDGKIDEVRIWSTALNSSIINSWKNKSIESSHPKSDSLKLYWDFENLDSQLIVNAVGTSLYEGLISGASLMVSSENEYVVGGYIPYYNMDNFVSANPSIVMKHLTHLYYFSISTNINGDLGRVSSTGVFTPFTGSLLSTTKSHLNTIKEWRGNNKTKIILVFGGWVSSDYIDEVAANPIATDNVANQLINFCIENELDGIDIDWEKYHGTVNNSDYVNLVSSIRSKISASSNPNLELSVTITPEHKNPEGLFGLFGNIDFLQIMSYGNSRISEGTQVPMSKIEEYCLYWKNAGLPSSKLVLGLPNYAKTIENNSGDGNVLYREAVAQYPNLDPDADFVVHNNKTYYFNGITTVKNKSKYVLENDLKGVMFWELSQDVNITNSKSLLNAVTEVIPITTKLLSNNLIKDKESQTQLKVFPNPSSGLFNVSFYSLNNSKINKLQVCDVNGRLIWESTKTTNTEENSLVINLSMLNSGFYILKIINGHEILTRKLIKN